MRIATNEDIPLINKMLDDSDNPVDFRYENELPDGAIIAILDEAVIQCITIGVDALEIHPSFLPEFRGKKSVEVMDEFMRSWFCLTPVIDIYTKHDTCLKHVHKWLKWVKMNPISTYFERTAVRCNIEDFIFSNAVWEQLGKSWLGHEGMRACMDGFLVDCIQNGNFNKAISIYNKYALLLNWDVIVYDDGLEVYKMGDLILG